MKKSEICCSMKENSEKGADNKSELSRVNRIRGQVEAIGRMIQDGAYCPNIITQIQAARSALGSLQASVLSAHLKSCVIDGIKKGVDTESEKLLGELMQIFKNT